MCEGGRCHLSFLIFITCTWLGARIVVPAAPRLLLLPDSHLSLKHP